MILGLICGGRKVYVAGRRLHHGRFGAWLLVAGVVLMLDDLLDFPWRFEA